MKNCFRKAGFFLLYLTFFGGLAAGITSCASHPSIRAEEEAELFPEELYIPERFEWHEIQEGFERFDFENPDFPVIYHAVKIDLTLPGLKLVAFPDENTKEKKSGKTAGELGRDIPSPFIFKSMTTLKFAKENACVIAMNSSPFGGVSGHWDIPAHLSSVRQVVGVHKAGGVEIACPVERYSAIGFKRVKEGDKSFYIAKILKNQKEAEIQEYDFVFGGFFTVLLNGQVEEFSVRNHNSRSGAGVSEDGKTLYLLVVEGERQSKSEGLSYPQCGQIFKAMGCYDALEVDGGGSSELVIRQKSVLTYPVLRVPANSFGFLVE